MEVMAVGFLTEELELDAETAQAFWPMYNAHKEELLRAGEDLKETQRAMNALQGNADAEFHDLLNRLEAEESEFPACVLNSCENWPMSLGWILQSLH